MGTMVDGTEVYFLARRLGQLGAFAHPHAEASVPPQQKQFFGTKINLTIYK